MEYEIFLYRIDGALSAVCHASYASDRHAAASAQSLLVSGLGRVAIWQEGRRVARAMPDAPSRRGLKISAQIAAKAG